ncbi:uncharacterized protein [Triticum aestivum]|uniref:uncharacterized protein isoform X1 n=1 Tax=Triticum aestivum TaxID=4565 RepID=UPI001D027131|nr:uncharacterized protein LOC123110298 isoform X1 [Triticum aestivum]
MDDANKPQRPQQEEEQKPMSEDKTTMMKVLSEDGGGEAEPSWESGDGDAADHNHRGWKAMPYVIGFRGWRPLQLRRVAGDSAPPSSTPTASPTGGSASWSVLLHPVAAGRMHAAGKLQRDGGPLHGVTAVHCIG